MSVMEAVTNPPVPEIVSWPQAIVYIVIILVSGALPSVLVYLNNRHTKEVKTTLTQNNGGSSIKDQLDRIEEGQAKLSERVQSLEDAKVAETVEPSE